MQIGKIKILKPTHLLLDSEMSKVDKSIVYCEIEYKRDRSSYAGMAFKIIDKQDIYLIRECEEEIVYKESMYEKIFRGCERDYFNSIKEIYLSEERNFGIEILFLIYSDVRSSKIIFEDLMNNIIVHLNDIKNYLDTQ